jgi:alpha-tubulin suppressor-like RCC1 family protein
MLDIQQDFPKLVKNNLIYYKIKKIVAGPTTSALISEEGELLLQGMNDGGQLGIGDELGKILYYFPDFMKKDNLPGGKNLKVIDVALGAFHTMVLCRDLEKNCNRIFGFGHCDKG